MALKERDIVIRSKDDDNNDCIDMPITRLANIESGADSKTSQTDDDYIPIIDSSNGEQMKKIKVGNLVVPEYTTSTALGNFTAKEKLSAAFGKISKAIADLIAHLADNVRHITAAERTAWNGKAAGNHTHTAADVGALTNIKIGTVTTGAAGSSASATASTSGTVTTLDLVIPKGDTGAKGATGAQGAKGDKGDTGANGVTPTIKAANGANINVVGTPSVTASTSGTTTTFTFNNLKGATGAQGAKGDKGDKGDAGAAGAAGAKGATGAAGTRGSRWTAGTAITGTSATATVFSGTGITDALVNDMYLNSSTGYVYKCTVAGAAAVAKWVYAGSIKGATGSTGATGAKGDKGDTGAAGAAGAKGATGAAGTRGSRWTAGTAITGTSATATVFSGTGITDALVNDMYLNSSTGYVYKCTVAGAAAVAKWVYAGSIKGATGSTGATGAKGDKGDTGAAGAAGAKGATGAAGTRGSRWTVGTAITGTSTTATVFSGTGITDALVNDMYLNSSTGYVYKCTVAGAAAVAKWAYAGSIKGATGATGATGAKGDTGIVNVVTGTVTTSAAGTVAYQTGSTKALIIAHLATAASGKGFMQMVLETGLSASMTTKSGSLSALTTTATALGSGPQYKISSAGVITISGFAGMYCVIWFK